MRLTSIPGWINSITHNNRQLPTITEFNNGMKEVRTYNNQGWVGEIRVNKSNGQMQRRSIYHRTVGGRVSRHQTDDVWEDFSYCYDYAGRLTVSANLTKANKTCANVGNWTGNDWKDQVFSYRADGSMASNNDLGSYNYAGSPVAHAPANINGTPLSYDANGNMTDGYDGKVMTYDGENRPLSVSKARTTTTYVYGADGSRLKKIVTAVGTSTPKTTLYVGNVELREPGTANETVIQYPHDNIRIVDGEVSYMFRDQLGSVRLIADQKQVIEERSKYLAFGREVENPTASSQAVETKGWIGERFDAGAGLQYLNARYYDPELSLFIQPDWFEVTEAGVGTNRYSYSFNDPVNLSDPSGNLVPAETHTERENDRLEADNNDALEAIDNAIQTATTSRDELSRDGKLGRGKGQRRMRIGFERANGIGSFTPENIDSYIADLKSVAEKLGPWGEGAQIIDRGINPYSPDARASINPRKLNQINIFDGYFSTARDRGFKLAHEGTHLSLGLLDRLPTDADTTLKNVYTHPQRENLAIGYRWEGVSEANRLRSDTFSGRITDTFMCSGGNEIWGC
jgi:RHS repeat-associated protein